MQCKDVPEIPILQFLSNRQGKPCFSFEGLPDYIGEAMPAGTPSKLVLAKMKTLIHRKLVSGCACGCRGDFLITKKGKLMLASQSLSILPDSN